MTVGITLEIAEKRYPDQIGHPGATAIRGLHARIAPNEFCAVFGPSGCGKSTLLNIIAGVDRRFSGSVRFDGARAPRIGYVFQSPRLLPWRTVRDNIALVLPRGADPAIVDCLLGEVGLAEAAGIYPNRLSGGMARRAALARAFAIAPDLLLLDEPFISLDVEAADQLRALLLRLLCARSATVLLVTHDAGEALALVDRILLLSAAPGRVIAEMPILFPREQRRQPEVLAALLADLARLAKQGNLPPALRPGRADPQT